MSRPRTCECGECKKCKHRDYMRAWYQRKTVDERRAWVARRDKEKTRARDRERNKTPARREALAERAKRWREENPQGYAAHTALQNAVRDGKITKEPCEVCGSTPVQAHHPDYSKPLDVRWLCPPCHSIEHRRY